MKWQPIETAPKDGTFVLVVCCGVNPNTGENWIPGVARFDSDLDCWMETEDQEDLWWEVTHWMPLPEPPEVSDEA